MRIRVSKTRVTTAAGAAAVTVVLTLGITGAVASVSGHLTATIDQCGQNLPRCGTPLVYRPFGQQFALQASAKRANARVITAEQDYNQVLQDWTYTVLRPLASLSAAARRTL